MIRLKRKATEEPPEILIVPQTNGLGDCKKLKTSDNLEENENVRIFSLISRSNAIWQQESVDKKSHLDRVIDKYASLLQEYNISTTPRQLKPSISEEKKEDDQYVYEYYEESKDVRIDAYINGKATTRTVDWKELEDDGNDELLFYNNGEADDDGESNYSTDSNAENYYGNDYPSTEDAYSLDGGDSSNSDSYSEDISDIYTNGDYSYGYSTGEEESEEYEF